jgi:hypothetical protein
MYNRRRDRKLTVARSSTPGESDNQSVKSCHVALMQPTPNAPGFGNPCQKTCRIYSIRLGQYCGNISPGAKY